MDYLIGIDLGTSQLVALAWEVEGDRLLAVERMRNTYALAAAEQDVEALLAAALQLLARLSRRPELAQARPLALGITGQMHGLALVDHTGRPLSSLITWQDERGEQRHRASGRTLVEEFRARLGSQALEDSGCLPATGYGGVTLLRLGSEGAWPSKAVALQHQLFWFSVSARAPSWILRMLLAGDCLMCAMARVGFRALSQHWICRQISCRKLSPAAGRPARSYRSWRAPWGCRPTCRWR